MHQLVNNQTYGKNAINFDDLHFPEECDTSFLTEEGKQILVDVKKQALSMSKEELEDWIVLPYYELIKIRMGQK